MSEKKRALKKKKIGLSKKATKVYFISAILVLVVSFFASVLSLSLPMVPLEVSMKVLENVIRLDGVLFGFTAVMISLVYRQISSRGDELLIILVFSVTAFGCYLLSIFMSFSFLMSQNRGNQIFVPVVLTCFGGLCSSIYMVLAIIGIEKEVTSHE